MMNSPRILIKLGGAALQTSAALEHVTETIRNYRSLGFKVIVVHGGGPAINAELTRRGITWEFVGGQRVTTPAMMEVIESTLCGYVNRKLVRALNAEGIPTVGLSGTDHQTLLCTPTSQELGLVGNIQIVDTRWIEQVLALPSSPLPMIAPLGVGLKGEAYNINADWAASHLAVALKVDQLLFVTDQTGIMDEEGQIISDVDADGLQNMIDCKVVSGGMLTKTRSVLHALKNGIPTVRILNAIDSKAGIPSGTLGTCCYLKPIFADVVADAKLAKASIKEDEHVAV